MSPKSIQVFGLLLKENLSPRPLKISQSGQNGCRCGQNVCTTLMTKTLKIIVKTNFHVREHCQICWTRRQW